MKTVHHKLMLILILMGAAVGLYYGWKLFWFLTDDAFIAFRYVSNSMLGYGYTWNPPPFRPVEGYTSFLWVVLLDGIWRVFGIRPPQSANYLSMGFSYFTLLLIVFVVMRMQLTERLKRYRLIFVVLILLGMLTNRTFLAWTSSGLETALFNFTLILWVTVTVLGTSSRPLWIFGITSSAALVYLSRPDGVLIVLGTVILIVTALVRERTESVSVKKWLLAVAPLAVVPIHLIWRRLTYGEWLPNTYYAKYTAAWPQAGVRYLASFILEYALWVWLFLFLYFIIVLLRRSRRAHAVRGSGFTGGIRRLVGRSGGGFRSTCLTVVIVILAGHLAYYTFIIGGDHFEYRVYSHLIPLIFVSFLWMLNTVNSRPGMAIAMLSLFVLLSSPVPWTHWTLSQNLTTRAQTRVMQVPISSSFPSAFRWYSEWFDQLQSWLIEHHIGMRHQEHKVFYEYLTEHYPPRNDEKSHADYEYPVMALTSVGVAGWVFPHVTIIDEFGLNDYVIARHRVSSGHERLMAHDRSPPFGYVESFLPNVFIAAPGMAVIKPRQSRLTADLIRANEKYWIDRVVHGIDTGAPPTLGHR